MHFDMPVVRLVDPQRWGHRLWAPVFCFVESSGNDDNRPGWTNRSWTVSTRKVDHIL
jgi:hypothetical protein